MLFFLDSRTGHRNIIQVKTINDLFICEECRNVLPYNVILSFDNDDGYYLGVIGAILGKNVKGVDGVFPHEYVRKLLEEYDSKDIDREIAYSFEGISRGRTVEDESRLLKDDLLRNDEISFMLKTAEGSTIIKSLDKYQLRADKNIYEALFDGTLDAIPVFIEDKIQQIVEHNLNG